MIAVHLISFKKFVIDSAISCHIDIFNLIFCVFNQLWYLKILKPHDENHCIRDHFGCAQRMQRRLIQEGRWKQNIHNFCQITDEWIAVSTAKLHSKIPDIYRNSRHLWIRAPKVFGAFVSYDRSASCTSTCISRVLTCKNANGTPKLAHESAWLVSPRVIPALAEGRFLK